MKQPRVLLAAVMGAFLVTQLASADTVEYGGEKYQIKLVDQARADHQLEFDPEPAGKTIERIVTLPYGVVLPDEPYPQFMNWFHVTTIPKVVERELLIHAGDPWSEDAVVESAHNLRSYLVLTAAQIVACKGSTPDKVIALVVTKDLWSLRPNFNFVFVGAQLQSAQAQLTEQNIAGRMKRVTVDLGLDLATYTGGLAYQDPRLLGGDLSMLDRADLIWNRASGALEGGLATFNIQQPLYTLDTHWAWIASAQYRNDIFRFFSDGQLAALLNPVTGEAVGYQYNRHLLDTHLGVTRSFGREQKLDVSMGYRTFVRLYSAPALAVQPATQARFESLVLPLNESAGMLYVSARAYEGYYHGLIDIEEFALTEDFRFGPDLSAELRLANPALGFSSSFFEPVLNATWTSYRADDLFVASSTFDIRYQPELVSVGNGSPWSDGSATLGIRNVSPRWGFLRLHTAARLGRRFNDLTHSFTELGGDNSLRGFGSAHFSGANFWTANAELRTRPLAIESVHLGLAAFLDSGSASDSLSQLSPHGSVGGGLRIGLPQFNRELIRIDLGFPLETLSAPAYVVAQYGQAF